MLESPRLVNRDDEERIVAGVPKAMRRLRRDDEHLVRVQLDDTFAGRPASAPFEEDEGLRVGMHVEIHPLPGGVRTTKTEMPTPARGRPSHSEAVGLNFISSRSKTSIRLER